MSNRTLVKYSATLYVAVCLVYLLLTGLPLWAQAISLSPEGLPENTRKHLLSETSFYVNGSTPYGLENIKQQKIADPSIAKLTLSLIAMRLVAKGVLNLDTPIAHYTPELIETHPFRVAITPRHILQETAGFAVPTLINVTLPLEKYIKPVRTAGQVTHHDPVGWALLLKLLEKVSGQPLAILVKQEILIPLGLSDGDFETPNTCHPLMCSEEMHISPQFLAAISSVLVWNQTNTHERYLPRALHQDLTAKPGWQLHPMGLTHTLGLELHTTTERHFLTLLSSPQQQVFIWAYPKPNVAFLHIGIPSQAYVEAINAIAKERFLPGTITGPKEAGGLIQHEPISGLYVETSAPDLSLKNRLSAMREKTVQLHEYADGQLIVKPSNTATSSSHIYRKSMPFYYTGAEGGTLVLSPFKQGGYMMLDGKIYRYVGIIGDARYVQNTLPFLIVVLLSSIIYRFSSEDKSWRNMALLTTTGTLLISGTLLAEYYAWETVMYVWDASWLVTLWRLVLNIGIALVLSQPLFTFSFRRNQKMPDRGLAIFLAPLHMGLITIAAMGMFLTMVAWGMIGWS